VHSSAGGVSSLLLTCGAAVLTLRIGVGIIEPNEEKMRDALTKADGAR
jgi:hypothetical protein